jgi:hypothetical protein
LAESFQGGVRRGSLREGIRARVAVHGANLEALTGDESFRIPLSRCSLEAEGRKILVREQAGDLVIWSDDKAFLQALERAPSGVLGPQIRTLRATARRRRLLGWFGSPTIAALSVYVAAVPVTRWAIDRGTPSIADRIGESAIDGLSLPTGLAPVVDGALGSIAEQLRPAVAPSKRSFRLLLAGYSDAHSFDVPPGTVIVTAGLVCSANEPDLVTAAVARELAHLESHDVCIRVAETVDLHTVLELARGDTSALRARMLDFADPGRYPGFTPEQQTAAERRASAILTATAAPRDAVEKKERDEHPRGNVDWARVRAEACELIGR